MCAMAATVSSEQLMWHYEQLRALPMTALAQAAIDPVVKEELRCGYSSKRCENIRTNKKGGGLHRFCEFHRRRANTNQWRVDNKRRMRMNVTKDVDTATTTATTTANNTNAPTKCSPPSSQPYPRRQPIKAVKATTPAEPAQCDKHLPDPLVLGDETDDAYISDSDLAKLTAILFDGEAPASTGCTSTTLGFMSMLVDISKEPTVSSPTAVTEVAQVKREWLV